MSSCALVTFAVSNLSRCDFKRRLLALAAVLLAMSVKGSTYVYVGVIDELHRQVVCEVGSVGESSVEDSLVVVRFVSRYRDVQPTYSLEIFPPNDFHLKEAKEQGVSYELPATVELLNGHVETTPKKCLELAYSCVVAPLQNLGGEVAVDSELRVQFDVLVRTKKGSVSNLFKDEYGIRAAVFSWDLTHWTCSASKEACVRTAEPADTGGLFNGWFE